MLDAGRSLAVVTGASTGIGLELARLCATNGFTFIAPPHRLCGDNAAMIAWAGIERLRAGMGEDGMTAMPRSRWPLDSVSEPVVGHGRRGAKA